MRQMQYYHKRTKEFGFRYFRNEMKRQRSTWLDVLKEQLAVFSIPMTVMYFLDYTIEDGWHFDPNVSIPFTD